VALVALVLLRKRRASQLAADEPQTPLVGAVAAGMDDLASERDPRRAVIKAYARMEGALGESGVPRRPYEAPLEYLESALLRLRVSGQSVARLTSLFERARFSQHEIQEPMRREALSALADLQAELESET